MSAPESISRIEKGSKELTSPFDWTDMSNQTNNAVRRRVKTRLVMNQGELRVLRPLLVFFNVAAFSFSAVVREMAPISSSLEKRATLTFLIMLYHAVNEKK
jgi:hypothetical protein